MEGYLSQTVILQNKKKCIFLKELSDSPSFAGLLYFCQDVGFKFFKCSLFFGYCDFCLFSWVPLHRFPQFCLIHTCSSFPMSTSCSPLPHQPHLYSGSALMQQASNVSSRFSHCFVFLLSQKLSVSILHLVLLNFLGFVRVAFSLH